MRNPWFEHFVHALDLVGDEWALNIVEVYLDVVLHEHDFVQRPHLVALLVALVLDRLRVRRHGECELQELLNLPQQPDEVLVEVHVQ